MENLRVYCADVGSIKRKKFGWARNISSPSKLELCSDIESFAHEITSELNAGFPVAVGFECPLFVPIREDPQKVLDGRNGDGNRSWSAAAGTAAIAAGMVELIWVLREIRSGLNRDISAFLDWSRFQQANQGLFIWEAFVSGKAKGESHCEDAAIAVATFCAALPDPTTHNDVHENNVFSLAGSALLRAGWSDDPDLLKKPCLVIKV